MGGFGRRADSENGGIYLCFCPDVIVHLSPSNISNMSPNISPLSWVVNSIQKILHEHMLPRSIEMFLKLVSEVISVVSYVLWGHCFQIQSPIYAYLPDCFSKNIFKTLDIFKLSDIKKSYCRPSPYVLWWKSRAWLVVGPKEKLLKAFFSPSILCSKKGQALDRLFRNNILLAKNCKMLHKKIWNKPVWTILSTSV